MKLEEKFKAVQLRKLGKSYSEIRKKLKVSKGTLSLWLRDIKLTTKQKNEIYIKRRQINAYKLAKFNQQKRIERTRQIVQEAKRELKKSVKNPLFLSGLMLYWAEGDKSNEREVVKFTNSDPVMIKFIMRWFRDVCEVPENKFKVCIHIHELHCRKDVENYWSKLTNIPLIQFHKTQIKPTSLRFRRNRLYDGTCAIIINNKDLFRRIRGWKLGFIETMKINDTSPRSSTG